MKKYFLIALLLVNGCVVTAQESQISQSFDLSPEAYRYVKAAVDTMRIHHYKTAVFDWNDMERRIFEKARGAKRIEETHEAIRFGIQLLGDHHSSFMIKKEKTPSQKVKAERRPPHMDFLLPSGRILKGGIGYIWVPYCMQQSTEEWLHFAQILHELIGAIEQYDPLGWIIDLRDNGGGNMWPMELGLGPLYGEGVLFHITGLSERKTMIYQDGTVLLECDGKDIYKLTLKDEPAKIQNPSRPIAVLIGPGTGSSGESAVVSFLGKDNVRTFGLPTYGATSSIQHFLLSDGSIINLAVALFADRLDLQYDGALLPHEHVKFDVLDSMRVPDHEDPVVEKALEWIHKR